MTIAPSLLRPLDGSIELASKPMSVRQIDRLYPIAIETPHDSSSLFWSLLIGYLGPHIDNELAFEGRYRLLFGNIEQAQVLRNEMSSYCSNLSQLYEMCCAFEHTLSMRAMLGLYLISNQACVSLIDLDHHVTALQDPNMYGSEVEIIAFSRKCNVNIIVYQDGSSNPISYGSSQEQLCLSRHHTKTKDEDHYRLHLSRPIPAIVAPLPQRTPGSKEDLGCIECCVQCFSGAKGYAGIYHP